MPSADPLEKDLVEQLARGVALLVENAGQSRFGVAVSGGPDSMALLDLAVRALPGRVEAATVDHGLRAASADEAAMVAEWCAGHAIAHATLHTSGSARGNVQQWARRQRYALLANWRRERRIDWILTAHHADDQLETMLMRLNRGAGVNGLAGVRARQGQVLRPLLGVRRTQLLAYATHRGLPYVEDPSNSDTRYDRAAIRLELRGAGWLDAQAAARSAAALNDVAEALDWVVDGLESCHVRADGGALVLGDTDLPRELLRRLVLRMVARLDPDAPAPRGDSVDRAIATAAAGGQASLGEMLLKGGETWRLSTAPPRRNRSLRKGSTD